MSPPRILIATNLYPDGGGISAIVENCVMTLASSYEVHVAIVDEREGRREQLPIADDRVHALTTNHRLKPHLMPSSLLYSLRVGAFLRRLVKQLQPAALLVQDGLYLPTPGLIATAGLGVPLVVMDHGTLTNSMDTTWQRIYPSQLPRLRRVAFRLGFALDKPWREARWRLGLRRADQVWYVGEELKPFIERAGGHGERYKQIIPPDFVEASGQQRAAARAALGVPDDAVLLNMVNRLSPEKGMDIAIDALEAVVPDFPHVHVLIAGDGGLEGQIRAQIQRAGLQERVRLLGRLSRPEVLRLQQASDFFLYTGTISCGVTIGLLEAMAVGVLPIVSDVPREQLELVGDAGWVYSAPSREELKSALREALSLDAAGRAERRRAVQDALAAYSRPSLSDRLEAVTAR